MKIFLGDLVHTGAKVSTWTIPLNIAFIAAYVRKHYPDAELRLFKRPEQLIAALKVERPAVLGLSFYVWNENLNAHVMAVAKSLHPGILTVGGGPIFTKLNADEAGARRFFRKIPNCDAYALNQGERPFLEVLRRFEAVGEDLGRFRAATVPGCLVNGGDSVQIGAPLDPIMDLDEIPSPYLTGLLDPFFDEALIPLLETNRSCPYRCTFCAWGIGTGKLARFSDERVLAEIDYIGGHCRKVVDLIITDANFGILERDREFAARLHARHVDCGFPGHVSVQWNKSRSDRLTLVAAAFQGLATIGASMQSVSPDVLNAVKRKNLPLEEVAALIRSLPGQQAGAPLKSELILGLPEETAESHIEANRQLIDLGANIDNYNLHLLPGTEMATPDSRARYFRQTAWRLHDNAFGEYEGERVFEGQEVVVATSTMSEAELRGFRLVHFLLQLMWGRRWYYDYLAFFRGLGVHPMDVVLAVAQAFRSAGGPIGDMFGRFQADHDLETFDTAEALFSHWADDAQYGRLVRGEYGKLNFTFTFAILLEAPQAFHDLLLKVAAEIIGSVETVDRDRALAQVREIVAFLSELRIDFSNAPRFEAVKRRSFGFDVLAWREQDYDPAFSPSPGKNPAQYEFRLAPEVETRLRTQLEAFSSGNLNLTLRKMSEYMNPADFFYSIRRAV